MGSMTQSQDRFAATHERKASMSETQALHLTRRRQRKGFALRRCPAFLVLVAGVAGVAAGVLPAGATPPGSNGKLVFERPGAGSNLFSVAPDGSSLTRLTNRKGAEGDSSWSPDGRRIAFSCARNPERGPYEICRMAADGTGLARLTRHRDFSVAPAWSPDGTKIVYATNAGRGDHLRLYVMNADGSAKRRLSRNRMGTDYADPQWSPDGASIAFAILKAGETQRAFDSSIARIDAADGGNLRRLTPRRGRDELNPNWSPDGARIAFETNRLFNFRQSDIWLMNADGSGKRRLTKTRFHETYPVFSPDGTRIAYAGDRDNRKLSKERLGRGFELYTMAADGSDIIRVTNNRRADLFPDWQPLP
jgi:Tol biopolymer transport system component